MSNKRNFIRGLQGARRDKGLSHQVRQGGGSLSCSEKLEREELRGETLRGGKAGVGADGVKVSEKPGGKSGDGVGKAR